MDGLSPSCTLYRVDRVCPEAVIISTKCLDGLQCCRPGGVPWLGGTVGIKGGPTYIRIVLSGWMYEYDSWRFVFRIFHELKTTGKLLDFWMRR